MVLSWIVNGFDGGGDVIGIFKVRWHISAPMYTQDIMSTCKIIISICDLFMSIAKIIILT